MNIICELIKRINADVRQERQHSDLIHGVETFKPDRLKHADTKEKIILPNAKGRKIATGTLVLVWECVPNNKTVSHRTNCEKSENNIYFF